MNPGTGEEQVFAIGLGRSTIGRTRENAIVCTHKSLSRMHAALEYDGHRVRLLDLDSKNGVFVHGKRVKVADILDGDTFRCGDVHFLLEDVAAASAPPSESKMSAVAQTLPSPLALGISLSKRPPRATTTENHEEGRYRDKLFALIRATEIVASNHDLDRLLDELAALAAQVLDVDRVAVLTIDRETLDLSPRVVKAFVASHGAPYSHRVIDWVVDHGSPGSFGDLSKDLSLPGDPRADHHIRAAMGVPIDPGVGLVGVLYADSVSSPDLFKPDDLAFLRALGNLTASALEIAPLRVRDPVLATRRLR